MTCYQRHLGWVFEEFGIPYDTKHRKSLDAELKTRLGLSEESHCPEVWASLKQLAEDDRKDLLTEIGTKLQA